jgi:hypothetical protein
MPALSTLRKRAAQAATWRGHKLKWSHGINMGVRLLQNAKCNCGAEVQINTKPAPNEIDIGGDAVAVNCTKPYRPKHMTRVYKLYTYDVWGNRKDGYNVNDLYPQGEIKIKCDLIVFNEGTPTEFFDYDPTDLQLSLAVGIKRKYRPLKWDGESDYTLTAERERDAYPVCELRFEGFIPYRKPWLDPVSNLKEALGDKS